MNYIDLLSPIKNIDSGINSIKEVDYKHIIQRKLWKKITKSKKDRIKIYQSSSSNEFIDFLQWMFENGYSYDWRLYGYVIKYLHLTNNFHANIVSPFLIDAANEWGLNDISKNRYIFLYYPNNEKLSILYEKPIHDSTQPKIKICRCDNFEQYKSSSIEPGIVFYSISTELNDLFNSIDYL